MLIQKIPTKYVPTFKTLADLTEEQMGYVNQALGEMSPCLNAKDLARDLPSIPELSRSDLALVIEAIVPLYSMREEEGVSNEDIANDIVSAARKTTELDKLSENEYLNLRKNLIILMQHERSLGVTSKVASVLTDHDNVFARARILTDIRPVFTGEADEKPEAAVIIHQLRIHYHSDNRCKDFFVALDTADVQALREVLDRADRKASVLQEVLKDTSMKYLDSS